MNYICFAHNNFTTVQQSSRTPRDLVIGDKARNHAFALFGCKVLAEIPESVKSKNPNLPRFVEGVYLHPEFSSMGVWGFLQESALVQRWLPSVLLPSQSNFACLLRFLMVMVCLSNW